MLHHRYRIDVNEMHTRILSRKEREILEKFVENGDKTDPNFRMLKTRINRNYETLKNDLVLVEKAMQRIGD